MKNKKEKSKKKLPSKKILLWSTMGIGTLAITGIGLTTLLVVKKNKQNQRVEITPVSSLVDIKDINEIVSVDYHQNHKHHIKIDKNILEDHGLEAKFYKESGIKENVEKVNQLTSLSLFSLNKKLANTNSEASNRNNIDEKKLNELKNKDFKKFEAHTHDKRALYHKDLTELKDDDVVFIQITRKKDSDITLSQNMIDQNSGYHKYIVNLENSEIADKKVKNSRNDYWIYNNNKYNNWEDAYKELVQDFSGEGKLGDESGKTYTQAQIAARDASGPFPTPENANIAIVGLNKKVVAKIGDGSGNRYTQPQIDHAKGAGFVAPISAIVGLNEELLNIEGVGDKSGNIYTQAQIDHAKGGDFVAPENAVVGQNIQATGDGSGKTYTQAQIAARDASGPFPTPENAQSGLSKVGENIAPVDATGDGSGSNYSWSHLAARDASGPFPTKEDALSDKAILGKNYAAVNPTGDGSGNTYTQAQIEHAKGGNFVAPENAVIGLNSPGKIDMKLNDPLSKENIDIINQLIGKFIPFGGINQPYFSPLGRPNEKVKLQNFNKLTTKQIQDKGFKNSDALNFESLIKEDAWSNQLIKNNLLTYDKVDFENKKIKWHASETSAQIGDGSGNTYTQAQIAARDASGPFPTPENAQSGLSKVGENIAKVDATGDGSDNTYTQPQIDHAKGGAFIAPPKAILGKNYAAVNPTGDGSGNTYTQGQIDHAKGGDFVAPENAVVGQNIQAIGDGSGKTYTQAQIAARDASGPFPTKEDANIAIASLNMKKKYIGDGSGNTYTQAQIDHAKGGAFVAPLEAIVGINDKQDWELDRAGDIEDKDIKALFEYITFLGWIPQPPSSNTSIGMHNFTTTTYAREFKILWNDNKTWENFKLHSSFTTKKMSDWDLSNLYDKLKFKFGKSGKITISKFKEKFPDYAHNLDDNGTFKWSPNKEIKKKGDGSGKTYTQAQIAARDASEPFPTKEDANIAIVGLNKKVVAKKGDGSGKTYTQAQIDARDASEPFPTKEDANIAIAGLNKKAVDATGDGSGNTYTRAQIDHAKGGAFIAQPKAIVGLNKNLKELAKTLIKKM